MTLFCRLLHRLVFASTLGLVSLFLPDRLIAQDEGEILIEIDFKVFPLGDAEWEGLYYQEHEGRFEELDFEPFSRSLSMRYRGPLPLRFYRQTMGPAGLPSYREVARVSFDPSWSEVLLFFTVPRTTTGASEFELVAMNDDLSGFPIDSLLFFNATGAPLIGVFGGDELTLPLGMTGPIDVSRHFGDGVFVGLAVRYADGFETVLENTWQFYPDNRTIVVLLPPSNPNSFRIRAYEINEYVRPKREED